MTDSSSSSPSGPTRLEKTNIGVPASIVLAGGLIALAIYFGGASIGPAATPAAGSPAAVPAVPAAPAAPTADKIRPVSADDHVRGPASAGITMIEYSDLQCPFCKTFHPTLVQALAEFPNDVRWVYRHLPLEAIHPYARGAALAAECAGEQGKFWEFVDHVFEKTTTAEEIAADKLPQIAQTVGVANASQFASCLESKKYDDRIKADIADAAAAGGRGTPYTVVIGPDRDVKVVSGAQPYAEVKAVIESFL